MVRNQISATGLDQTFAVCDFILIEKNRKKPGHVHFILVVNMIEM